MPRRPRLAALPLALALCLAAAGLAACGSSSSSSGTTTTSAAGSSASLPCKGPVKVEGGLPTPVEVPVKKGGKELEIVDLKEGEGPAVTATDTVTVDYVGVACSTGKVFDSSHTKGQPVSFPLDQVIPGFAKGLVGMKAGGQRALVIPPAMGYGDQGAGSDIKPGETLVFVIDLLKIGAQETTTTQSTAEPLPCKGPVKVEGGLPEPVDVAITDGGATLQTDTIKPGTGSATATASDTVSVQYVGVACSTGKVFDSSWQRGQPASFSLADVVPGFAQGIEGMKVGERRSIVIPPQLGYGDQGAGSDIKPGETLVFVVDLLKIS